MTATITIHADSTNRRNAGPGGYAAIIFGTRVDNFPFQTATSGGYPQTTNQRMDLMAVIAGLNTLDDMVNAGKIGHRHTINIESHALQIVRAVNRNWLEEWRKANWQPGNDQPIPHHDLWEKLAQLNEGREIKYTWAKNDAGDPVHNQAIRLANQHANRYTPQNTENTALTTAKKALNAILGKAFEVTLGQDCLDVKTPLRHPDGGNITVMVTPDQRDPTCYQISDQRYPTSMSVLRYHNLPPGAFTRMAQHTCANLDLELRPDTRTPLMATTANDPAGVPDAVLRVAQAAAQVTAAMEFMSHS